MADQSRDEINGATPSSATCPDCGRPTWPQTLGADVCRRAQRSLALGAEVNATECLRLALPRLRAALAAAQAERDAALAERSAMLNHEGAIGMIASLAGVPMRAAAERTSADYAQALKDIADAIIPVAKNERAERYLRETLAMQAERDEARSTLRAAQAALIRARDAAQAEVATWKERCHDARTDAFRAAEQLVDAEGVEGLRALNKTCADLIDGKGVAVARGAK